MKKYSMTVKIMKIKNNDFETVKTVDGFESNISAVQFAKQELEWRGSEYAAEVDRFIGDTFDGGSIYFG